MRELTLRPAEIVHPDELDGRRIWLDPEVQDLVDRLHFGDPSLGWEGDARLALYRTADSRWELQRLEHDGQYRLVCRSRPGLALDNRLIQALVAQDQRRGFDPKVAVDAHNDAVQNTVEEAAAGKTFEAADKLKWALNKDIGYLA